MIAWISLSLGIVVLTTSLASAGELHGSRSFYDNRGSFAGSSQQHGNSTSFSDRDGHFAGSSIRNSDGTISVYDRNGHFTGSAIDTGPRR